MRLRRFCASAKKAMQDCVERNRESADFVIERSRGQANVHCTKIMKRLPPLTAVEAFVETARLGSVKAAAESLALSSPALSRRVQALERHVGRPLFERRHQAVLLNPDGEQLLAEIGPALEELGQAMERATGQAELMRLKLARAAAVRLLPADAAARRAARAPSRPPYRHRHPPACAGPARRGARRGDRAGARGRSVALQRQARRRPGGRDRRRRCGR